MKINSTMLELLQQIITEEPQHENSLTEDDFVSQEVGVELIQIYHSTSNLEIRELITGFMHEAGYTWLRRLVTKDMGQLATA